MALTKVQSALTNTGIANVLDYGAVGDGSTNDSAAILAATVASNNVVFPAGNYLVSTNFTFPADTQGVFYEGAKITVDTGAAITWNGSIKAGDYQQIFDGDLVQSAFISGQHTPYTLGLVGSPKIAYSTPFWFGAAADYDPVGDTGTDDKDAIVAAQYFGLTTKIPTGIYKTSGNIVEKRSNAYIYGNGGSSRIYQRGTGPSGTGQACGISCSGLATGVVDTTIENIWVDCDALTNENMAGMGGDVTGFMKRCKIDILGGKAGRSVATIQGPAAVTDCYIRVVADEGSTEASSTRFAATIENSTGTPADVTRNKIDVVIKEGAVSGAQLYDVEDCEINFLCGTLVGDPALGAGTLARIRGTGIGNKITAKADTITGHLLSSDANQSYFVVDAQCESVIADGSDVVEPFVVNGSHGEISLTMKTHLDTGGGVISGSYITGDITAESSNTTSPVIDFQGSYNQITPFVKGTGCTSGVILFRGTANKLIGGFVERGSGLKGVRFAASSANGVCSGVTVIGDGAEAIRVETGVTKPTITGNTLIGTTPTIVVIASAGYTGVIANNANDTGTPSGKIMRLGAYSLWVDATGDLRILSGDTASDTGGVVVGTQA